MNFCPPLKTKTQSTLDLLRAHESRNVTFMDSDGSWPIVWERARGVHVWDMEGKKYLDLTAAFGVAAAGHANPGVVRAETGTEDRSIVPTTGGEQRAGRDRPEAGGAVR